MLQDGCARHAEAAHGEQITIVATGDIFIGIVEVEADLILNSDMSEDRRSKVMVRFIIDPNLTGQDVIQTQDGRSWNATRSERAGFLTNDYELREIIDGTDT